MEMSPGFRSTSTSQPAGAGMISEGQQRIRALRLRHQRLAAGTSVAGWVGVADVARGMLALQGQDPAGASWALALRASSRPDQDEVAAAFERGEVVRNRPSRGTLQVCAPEDLHWLSATMTPRSLGAAEKRRQPIGVTPAMIEGVGEVLRDELADGATRTRAELVGACRRAGIELDGTQAGHVLRHHTEVMTIIFVGAPGRVDRFGLADDQISTPRRVERDEALAEIARRYFAARGPATPQCLGWWANLSMGDVRAGIDAAGSALTTLDVDGDRFVLEAGAAAVDDDELATALDDAHLLPPFDEYLLGYRHRDPVIDPTHVERVVPGRNGMFKPIVVVGGEVVGTWSRAVTARRVTVIIDPFVPIGSDARDRLAECSDAYGRFLGRDVALRIT
jgi:hypothetical protein